jgi:Ca2+-binding RTX toxin-like protein
MRHTTTGRAAAIATGLAIAALTLAPATAGAAPIKLKLFSCDVSATHLGTNGSDTINTGGANDRILLLGGQDHSQAAGGNDLICGGEGSDSGLYGQGGNDVIRGGNGNEHAVSGHEGDDWIFGDGGDDVLGAHLGKDHVYGGADDDKLYGDTWGVGGSVDADVLNGGSGVDTCYPGWEDTVVNCETVVWPW